MHNTPESQEGDAATVEAPARDTERELVEQLQRLQAEFENYRKRVDSESARLSETKVDALLKDILPVLDSLEQLRKHNLDAGTKDEGATLIRDQLRQVLARWDVQVVATDGLVDPRLHEVYFTETSTRENHSILDVLQDGYTRHGIVLRTAKVKAARKENHE